MQLTPASIKFFGNTSHFREWLEGHFETEKEVWVGFHKKQTGKPSMTWSQSVDVALCFGWIDGIRKSIDDKSYTIRFTPRSPKSIWSSVNIKKVAELTQLGLMKPSGIKAFEAKTDKNSEIYSFEQKVVTLDSSYLKKFKENTKAWEFFSSMPPSYQKTASWWVMSAKQEATRIKRLETLIHDSQTGERIASLRR